MPSSFTQSMCCHLVNAQTILGKCWAVLVKFVAQQSYVVGRSSKFMMGGGAVNSTQTRTLTQPE